MFVHDLSQRRTKTSLQMWATKIAVSGTFSAPLASGGPGGLPVPCIVIGNKADITSKEGIQGSSGNLVDVACQWVEKQGLLPPSGELPLTESFPGSGGLLAISLIENMCWIFSFEGKFQLISPLTLVAYDVQKGHGKASVKLLDLMNF